MRVAFFSLFVGQWHFYFQSMWIFRCFFDLGHPDVFFYYLPPSLLLNVVSVHKPCTPLILKCLSNPIWGLLRFVDEAVFPLT